MLAKSASVVTLFNLTVTLAAIEAREAEYATLLTLLFRTERHKYVTAIFKLIFLPNLVQRLNKPRQLKNQRNRRIRHRKIDKIRSRSDREVRELKTEGIEEIG